MGIHEKRYAFGIAMGGESVTPRKNREKVKMSAF
jgi:hypothetical protein